MAWYLTAPSDYLNQWWLISKIQWQYLGHNSTRDTSATNYWYQLENYSSKFSLKSPRSQCVKIRTKKQQYHHALCFTPVLWIYKGSSKPAYIKYDQGNKSEVDIYGKNMSPCTIQHMPFIRLWVDSVHMMTSSNGNIFRVTGPLCGEFTGPGEFPTQRPVTRSFDVYFDLRLNKRLSKQPWGWWFEMPS